MLIGAHVREDDPVAAAAERGADVVQMFLADPQGWKKPPAHPQAAASCATGPLTVVVHAPYVVNLASLEQPDPHPLPQAGAPARRRARPRSARSGSWCTAGTSPRRTTRRTAWTNWRKFFARQADEGGFAGARADREHRGRRLRDGAPVRRAGPAVGRGRASSASASASTPATRFAAGEDLADAVDRIKAITGRIDLVHLNDSRDEFGSGARPAREHRRRHDRRRTCWSAVCAAAGAPVVVETPAEGQAADIAFLRERLGCR